MAASSHNIKPGRRRWGFRAAPALLFGLIVAIVSSHVEAVSMHRSGEADRLLHAIIARQDPLGQGSSAPPSTPAPTSSKSSVIQRPSTTKTSSSSSTPTNGTTTQTTTPQLTALPTPFDSNLGMNFTNPACPLFLKGLGKDPSFENCLPLSVIMQSLSFFQDEATIGLLDQVLDATCNVDFPSCQAVMDSYAQQLTSTNNCGDDYASGNPVVATAYRAFLSYKPLYQAGCLKQSSSEAAASNQSTPQYCFAAAATNDSAPNNAYIYSLPLGSPLPPGPFNCTTCLQQTMGFFATAATNATSPLSSLYAGAAKEINTNCGPSWVKPNITINQSTQISGAEKQTSIATAALIAAMMLLVVWV